MVWVCLQVVESYRAYSLLKAKAAPASESKPQHSKSSEPQPVPPQRRRSSFLHLLLSPNKCPAIREEDGPGSPHTPEPKTPVPVSSSSGNSVYETPKLNLLPTKSGRTPFFPSIRELTTSTPKDDVDHQDSSHDEMATAEDWEIDDMCPLSPGGQALLCEGTGEISLRSKPPVVDKPVSLQPFIVDSPTHTADGAMVCDQEEASTALVLAILQFLCLCACLHEISQYRSMHLRFGMRAEDFLFLFEPFLVSSNSKEFLEMALFLCFGNWVRFGDDCGLLNHTDKSFLILFPFFTFAVYVLYTIFFSTCAFYSF